MKFVLRLTMLAPVMLGLTGCLSFLGLNNVDSVPPADRQLPASTQALLAIKGMKQEAPIFVRIFKEESELEVWKLKDGRFRLFRTYPICAWSGGLGPKVQQGDRQAPEGFYTVGRGQMNPHSLYHLAFNIGFPNAYDHANGHTGSALMIHGDCKSVGCYAMTDAYIEEIYILAREAFNAGQTKFHVHALPFRMTAENMARHRDSPWYPFWIKLKEGYDSFEAAGKPPIVKVCAKQYLVNVQFRGQTADPAPDAECPLYSKIDPAQMPGIEGVPQTVLANLSKPEPAAPAAAAPPVVMASSLPQNGPAMTLSSSVAEDTSASPVITRPAARPSVIASTMPAKAPAAPVYSNVSPKSPVSDPQTPPVRVAASMPGSGTAYQQIGTPPQAALAQAPTATALTSMDSEVSKAVDPNALQKPNRSGKGGKLSGGPSPQPDGSQSVADGNAAPQGLSLSFSGQR
jgi:murein L,D-transpeptidase YafK